MASFQPVVVLYGSGKSISTISLRLPVSFVFAIDEVSLENILTVDPEVSDAYLQRYFVILLEPISSDGFERLQTNHRVQAIYSRESLSCITNPTKIYRIINKQLQQFTLDLTADIVHFLTIEGEKQAKLEQLHLTKIYYRQARLMKEWAMSSVKAEPCHILIIPLNSNQENLQGTQERLHKLCTKLGYPSVIIRNLDNYIPSSDEEKPSLLPYAQTLFSYEHPGYICELIKKLSPLRLYLYGNEELILSEWSKLMIGYETHVMEDEDNWCTFIENEIRHENEIFLVVSGSFGYELYQTAYHFMSILRFVYIYCSRIGLHGNWIKYCPKIRGVFNDSLTLGEKITQDFEQIKQKNNEWELISTPVMRKNSSESIYDSSLTSIPLTVYNEEQANVFIAHQRTIDTLLCLPLTDKSRVEMITEFRRIYTDDETILNDIDLFEKTYYENSALQWYTRDSFLYRLINKILRSSDVNMMFKMRYFLTDLYNQLNDLYTQRIYLNSFPIKEKVYRGQIMSKTQFDYFQKLQGEIISINTFLSTTTSLQIALLFAKSTLNNQDFIPILFCIETNSSVQHKRPYANISNFSQFNDEDEVLFSMGSLFHIQSIELLDKTENISVIYLHMIDQNQIGHINFSQS